MADWARGILMTSISPQSSLRFKVLCLIVRSGLLNFRLLYVGFSIIFEITLDKIELYCRLRGGSAGDFLWI